MVKNQISSNQPMKESAGDKSDHLSLGSDPDHYDQPLSEIGNARSPSNSNESMTRNSVALQNHGLSRAQYS